MSFLINIFEISIFQLLYLCGILILIGFFLGFLERQTSKLMQRTFGWKGVISTACIGTPIHELGHAIMCIIFGHKITKIKFLDINSTDGTLGYVQNSYNKNNIYQRIGNLFIGIGPFFSGIAAILLCMYFLLPNSLFSFEHHLITGFNFKSLNLNLLNWCFAASFELLKNIFVYSNLLKINFWIFLVLSFAISCHIALSKPDIKGALDGFIVLFVLIFIINCIAKLISVNTNKFLFIAFKYNAYFSAFLIMALMFSIIAYLISLLCYLIKKIFFTNI